MKINNFVPCDPRTFPLTRLLKAGTVQQSVRPRKEDKKRKKLRVEREAADKKRKEADKVAVRDAADEKAAVDQQRAKKKAAKK